MLDVLSRRLPGEGVARATIPAPALVLCSIVSVQLGAALTKGLFATVGPAGAVFLRTAFGALILLVLWRPRFGASTTAGRITVVAFGLNLAVMSLSFYTALERLPLSATVTLGFVGPLGVALLGSRRALDLLWGGLAVAGIVLLGPLDGHLDPVGVAWALLAGVLWGCSIPLNARTGRLYPGVSGLAIAMGIAALCTAPFGIASGGLRFLDARVLIFGLAVALLSSALPFALELSALRRLPTRTFGILLSLEPVAAAIVGAVALGEGLAPRIILAIALIVVASIGATMAARPKKSEANPASVPSA